MPKRQYVLEEWNNFSKLIFKDVKISETQRREMKRAFFAGCQMLLYKVMSLLEDGHEPTAKDLQVMESISTELSEFAQRVGKGIE
jgi:hypothetical protein